MLPNVKALKNMVTKAKRRLGVLEKGAAVGIKNDEDLKRHEKAVHELINMRDAYQAMLDYVNKRMKASEVKTSKVKPEQPVGDLFAGLFDEPNNNETADSNSSSPSQTVAGAERPDTVGIDETGTDGAERTTAVAGTDGERSTDASRENGREAADGAVHGTDEVGEYNHQSEIGDVMRAQLMEQFPTEPQMSVDELLDRALFRQEKLTEEEKNFLRENLPAPLAREVDLLP